MADDKKKPAKTKQFLDVAKQFMSTPNDEDNTNDTYDRHEKHEEQHMQNNNDALDAHAKKGRKKLPRINMAFYGENYDYLVYISRLSGKNITEYVNSLVDKDREINQDKIDRAKALLNE